MKKTRKQTAAGIAVMLVLAMALGGCGKAAQETAVTERGNRDDHLDKLFRGDDITAGDSDGYSAYSRYGDGDLF